MTTILADIGGTYARFGVLKEDGAAGAYEKLEAARYDSLYEALSSYAAKNGVKADNLRLATAAWPDEKGVYYLADRKGWNFEPASFAAQGCNVDVICNDFVAASYGALSSEVENKVRLREGEGQRNAPVLVVGPGTGLGLSYAMPEENGRWRVQGTFGAHMVAGAHTDEQHEILKAARLIKGGDAVLVYEDVAAGRGLGVLYRAVCSIKGITPQHEIDPRGILANAAWPEMADTIRLMHEFLGLFIHSVLVTTHGFGGVYLSGGLIDRLLEKELFDFASIEKMITVPVVPTVNHVVQATPVWYISDPFLALKGLKEMKR